MTDQPEAPALRSRIIGTLRPCNDATVVVAHLYKPEGQAGPCDHDGCSNDAHDPGLVSLYVEHGKDSAMVELDPGEALELANRLTRTANLVYEAWEDTPDMEREVARLTRAQTEGP